MKARRHRLLKIGLALVGLALAGGIINWSVRRIYWEGGSEPPPVAGTAQAREGKSEAELRQALARDEANHGKDHPEVVLRLSELAGYLSETARSEEAVVLLRRAIAIYESSAGPDDGMVAVLLHNLSRALEDSGRYSEPEPVMRRAIEIEQVLHGETREQMGILLTLRSFIAVPSHRMKVVSAGIIWELRRALTILG